MVMDFIVLQHMYFFASCRGANPPGTSRHHPISSSYLTVTNLLTYSVLFVGDIFLKGNQKGDTLSDKDQQIC